AAAIARLEEKYIADLRKQLKTAKETELTNAPTRIQQLEKDVATVREEAERKIAEASRTSQQLAKRTIAELERANSSLQKHLERSLEVASNAVKTAERRADKAERERLAAEQR